VSVDGATGEALSPGNQTRGMAMNRTGCARTAALALAISIASFPQGAAMAQRDDRGAGKSVEGQPAKAPRPEASDDPALVAFLGVWEGVGRQEGSTWEMRLTVTRAGVRVDYPSLDCGGEWIARPPSPPAEPGFIERLTYGHARCVDNGFATLALAEDGALLFRWSRAPGAAVEATARLKRSR
jgi:hypothetical protein